MDLTAFFTFCASAKRKKEKNCLALHKNGRLVMLDDCTNVIIAIWMPLKYYYYSCMVRSDRGKKHAKVYRINRTYAGRGALSFYHFAIEIL